MTTSHKPKLGILLNVSDAPLYVINWIQYFTKSDLCDVQLVLVTDQVYNPEVQHAIANRKIRSLLSSRKHLFVSDTFVKSGILQNSKAFDLVFDFCGYPAPLSTSLPILRPSFIFEGKYLASQVIANAMTHHCTTFTIAVNDGNNEGVYTEGKYKLLNYQFDTSIQTCLHGMQILLEDCLRRYSKGACVIQASQLPLTPFANPATPSRISYLLCKLRHKFSKLFFKDVWNIATVDASIESLAFSKEKHNCEWMTEPNGSSFQADPFGYDTGNKQFKLFEYYNSPKSKGILYIQTDNSNAIELLNLPVHLSYPYLFNDGNTLYCLPEQSKSSKLDLYVFNTEFEKLVFKRTIIEDFAAVDASIIQYEGKWWLFCTNAENKGADLRLYLFYAETLDGPWSPHAENPVKTDIASARPGGNLFHHKEKIFRPAQDSSIGYGSSLVIFEIEVLTPEKYSEKEVNRLNPAQFSSRYSKGLHTLSRFGNRTLIDGKRSKFIPFAFLHQ